VCADAGLDKLKLQPWRHHALPRFHGGPRLAQNIPLLEGGAHPHTWRCCAPSLMALPGIQPPTRRRRLQVCPCGLRICSITGQGPSFSFQPGNSRIPSVGFAAWRVTRPPYLHQSLWMSQTVTPMGWQLWSSSAGVVSIQPTYLTYLRSCTAKLFDFSCDFARGLDVATQAPACLREEDRLLLGRVYRALAKGVGDTPKPGGIVSE